MNRLVEGLSKVRSPRAFSISISSIIFAVSLVRIVLANSYSEDLVDNAFVILECGRSRFTGNIVGGTTFTTRRFDEVLVFADGDLFITTNQGRFRKSVQTAAFSRNVTLRIPSHPGELRDVRFEGGVFGITTLPSTTFRITGLIPPGNTPPVFCFIPNDPPPGY